MNCTTWIAWTVPPELPGCTTWDGHDGDGAFVVDVFAELVMKHLISSSSLLLKALTTNHEKLHYALPSHGPSKTYVIDGAFVVDVFASFVMKHLIIFAYCLKLWLWLQTMRKYTTHCHKLCLSAAVGQTTGWLALLPREMCVSGRCLCRSCNEASHLIIFFIVESFDYKPRETTLRTALTWAL